MITELSTQNFKSWKDTGKLQMAPLTCFFGANSSGKTSILQTLLMLKQTVEQEGKAVIDFGDADSLVNLGSFKETVHQHDLNLKLAVGVSWQLPEKLTVRGRRDYPRPVFVPFETDSLSFSMAIAQGGGGSVRLDSFCYSSGGHTFKIDWGTMGYMYNSRDFVDVINLFRCYGVGRQADLLQPFAPLQNAFEDLFHNVHYLGPLRQYPRSHYTWPGNHPKDVGPFGEDTVFCLLSNRVQLRDIDKSIPKWLQRLDLIHSYRLSPISAVETGYEFLVRKHENGPEVRLTDVGFGVSQVLPVLVLCYYVPEGSILILEQPEAHLHPKAQSELADMLVEVVKHRGVQIILESHSEHLLLRLMRRIAEEQISSDQTAIYFCDIDSGTSEIEKLEVDAYGNITNWPKNFFGDATDDLVEKTKAEMIRKKG